MAEFEKTRDGYTAAGAGLYENSPQPPSYCLNPPLYSEASPPYPSVLQRDGTYAPTGYQSTYPSCPSGPPYMPHPPGPQYRTHPTKPQLPDLPPQYAGYQKAPAASSMVFTPQNTVAAALPPNLPYFGNQQHPTSTYVVNQQYAPSTYVVNQQRPTSTYVINQQRPTSTYVVNQQHPTSTYIVNQQRPTSTYVINQQHPTSTYIVNQQYAPSTYVVNQQRPTSTYVINQQRPTSTYVVNKQYPATQMVLMQSGRAATGNYITSGYPTATIIQQSPATPTEQFETSVLSNVVQHAIDPKPGDKGKQVTIITGGSDVIIHK
ncbi:uncharacterized protein [Heptranchias perlo]|uniref:uncharacterized protein n=1 Tax=Heptranchias perlo TaxID=212740 RepID=UPI00355950AE